MKITHKKPTRETWTVEVMKRTTPWLVEDAPIDPETRAIHQLILPVKDFLNTVEHKMFVDRGDFGEGDEWFYITLYSQSCMFEFQELSDKLKEQYVPPVKIRTPEEEAFYESYLTHKALKNENK